MTQRQRNWVLPPVAFALVAGVFSGRETDGISFPLFAFVAALFAVFLLKGRLRFTACVLAGFTLGACAGCIAFHPVLPPENEYDVRGVISDEVTAGSFGQYRLYLSDVRLDGRPLSGGALWTFYSDGETLPDLLPGKAVSFRASLYRPRGAVNPDGYNFRESLLQRGVTAGLYGKGGLTISDPDCFSFSGTVASVRHSLSVSLQDALGEETGAYAAALLLGMRSMIPSEDRQSFSNLGIAHILSVSGFHVGVLIGMLASIFRLLKLRQGIRICLYALILFAYAALCGMSQPVIRASLLLLFAAEGKIMNRPRSGIHLLSGVLFVMVLLSPAQVTSASFQMTFCAAFGIIWFAPLSRRLCPFRKKITRALFSSLMITFGAQLGILFPELMFFQRFPLLVFLISFPATFIFSILILLFWLMLLLIPFPEVSSLLSDPLSAATGLLLHGIRSLGAIPGMTLWIHMPNAATAAGVILIFLGCCAFVRFRRLPRAAFLMAGTAALVISLLPVPHTSTEYIQFSAGNADAAVLWDRNKVYVFDTGENDATLSGYLRAHRLVPDAVILTHLHADHAGGLRSMIEDGIPVHRLFLPEGAETQNIHPDFLSLLSELRTSGTEIIYLGRGDVLPLPSGILSVLWPEKGKTRPGQDANDYSLVCRLTLRGSVLLQTGDLAGKYELYCGLPADLLKAAHHGSLSSTSQAFLDAVSPDAILLSCRSESRLQSFLGRVGNIHVFGTPETGAVTVVFEEGGYTVLPFISD